MRKNQAFLHIGSKGMNIPSASRRRFVGAALALVATSSAHASAPLVQVWKARNLIQGYLTAVEAEIDRRLHAGLDVPGMGLFIGRAGNRAYSDEEQAEAILKASRLGADAIYTKKLISPAQAEKLLKKDKPRIWKKLEDVISQSEGKPTADLSTCGKTPFVVKIVEPTDFPNLDGDLDDDDDLLN